jgi:hypothetical protein
LGAIASYLFPNSHHSVKRLQPHNAEDNAEESGIWSSLCCCTISCVRKVSPAEYQPVAVSNQRILPIFGRFISQNSTVGNDDKHCPQVGNDCMADREEKTGAKLNKVGLVNRHDFRVGNSAAPGIVDSSLIAECANSIDTLQYMRSNESCSVDGTHYDVLFCDYNDIDNADGGLGRATRLTPTQDDHTTVPNTSNRASHSKDGNSSGSLQKFSVQERSNIQVSSSGNMSAVVDSTGQ